MKLSQRRLARPSLGGMLATRQGSLMLALICAACAAGILIFALGRYKTSLKTPVAQASVLVASAQIPKGTSGQTVADDRLFRLQPVAASQVTPGAISDVGALANETAAVNILPGQQLTTADFAGFTDVAETLPANMRAVSVSIGESPGDTDVLRAGDYVDIYATTKSTSGSPTPTSGSSPSNSGSSNPASSSSPSPVVVPILTDVLVLKPGSPLPARRDGLPITGGSMVLAIPADQVQLVIGAELNSTLYLSLRPPNATATPGAGLASRLAQLSVANLNNPATTPTLTTGSTP